MASPPEPVNVVANQIVSEGENLVYASGTVEITRPDVLAKGDSAFLDSRREFAKLMRSPSVVSKGERPFTLTRRSHQPLHAIIAHSRESSRRLTVTLSVRTWSLLPTQLICG